MMYEKNTIDYQINVFTMQEMERIIPMTPQERKQFRKWVYSGHDPETNPWGHYDADGLLMCYIQAYRLEFGYSSGPWDYWHGPEPEDF